MDFRVTCAAVGMLLQDTPFFYSLGNLRAYKF
jgi:hypothetical protein